MSKETKSYCYIDSNIFLDILWKEPLWGESDECLNCNKIICCTSDVNKAITEFKFFSKLGDMKELISNADSIEEVKEIINNTDKGLLHDLYPQIKKYVDNYLSISDATDLCFNEYIDKINRNQIRTIFHKAVTIKTGINWSYLRGPERMHPDFFMPKLNALYGEKDVLDNITIKLILDRYKKIKNCLRDNEDAINYSIAVSTMNDYFITRDNEFFDQKTKKCLKKRLIKYIIEKPKDLLNLVK